jgi:hypothetical protein
METFHGKQVPLWYIPPVASDADWAWAAGIFEGAGAVVTINGGRDLRLALNLTDEDVVRRYAQIVESRVLGPYRARAGADGSSRRPTFRCNLNCRFAIAALARMWPWLGSRRRDRCRELGFEPPRAVAL